MAPPAVEPAEVEAGTAPPVAEPGPSAPRSKQEPEADPEPDPTSTTSWPRPVVAEPPADVTPARVPGTYVALLAGAVLVLALGVVVPWDSDGRSLITPHFGPLADSTGGVFTALSPLAVVLVAAVATVMAARARRLQLAAGLLIACGIAATAKYLGVLGRAANPGFDQDVETVSVLVFGLVVASSIALILIGIQLAQAAGTRLGRDARSARATGLMLGAAGFLTLAGCLVPFNTGGTDLPSRAVVPDEGAFSFDAVVGGLALLGLALCLQYLPRWLAAGMVLALAIESAALWIRYLGVPVAQSSDVGGFALGGLLGLVGAALALVVGVRLVRGGSERAHGADAPG